MKYYLLLLISAIFWGLSWPIAKIIVNFATPIQLGFFRFLFASIIFLPVLFFQKKNLSYRSKLKNFNEFFILGAIGIFGYGFLFLIGIQYTTASYGSVIAGIQPALIAILAGFFFKEWLHPKWRYWGILFGFIGVLIIIGISAFIDFNLNHLIGNLIIFTAMIFWSSYSVYGKKVMKSNSPFETTTWATFFGMILFGIGALIENKWNLIHITNINLWIGLVIQAIGCTVIGYFCFFYAIGHIGATRTGIFINLVPVFGTFFSVLILNEPLSWALLLGLVSIIGGIFIINFPSKNRKNKNG